MANISDTTFANGRVETTYNVNVTRSMTSNQTVGITLPAGFTVSGVRVGGVANSNAGGSATISVGSTNSTTGVFVSSFNVATNGNVLSIPSAVAVFGQTLIGPTAVTAQYNETGTASTSGGPWTVVIAGYQI